ncbi:sulfatase family protein [Psittacicella hinzii]|uniref:Arylsulfatase n=1 Tax=Psittacicella hinzii TaxID=2028575 RepID=A0A3A1YQT7_9GAMM|nr:sulfatase-like hydrolase/transferase [Psittacicella hinzii]RIY39310.1 arylsulfatase [Psittacicella hinzii]
MKLSLKPWYKCLALASLVAPATMLATPSHAVSTDPSRPNILVIVMDDLGIGQLNFNLATLNKNALAQKPQAPRYAADLDKLIAAAEQAMPNISELAAQGVKMTNAFVAHAVSGPSRAAIFTGKAPGSFGIYGNDDSFSGVPLEQKFLPELFQAAGYNTANIGKFHNARVNRDRSIGRKYISPELQTRDYHDNWSAIPDKGFAPQDRGFDFSYSYFASGAALYNSPAFWRNDKPETSWGYTTHNLTKETMDFIDQSGDKPFYINLAYSVPHIPLEQASPAKYMDKFNTGNVEADKYYASLNAADEGIGKIIAQLKEKNALDNTIIFFLSDNGSVHEAPLPLNGNNSSYKGLYHNGALNVPFIVYYPRLIPAGSVNDTFISAMDILPTSLRLAGIKIPYNLKLDGKDIMPVLAGKTKESPHKYLYWAGPGAFHYSEENMPFWSGYWDYITYKADKAPNNPNLERNAKGSWAIRDGEYALIYLNDGSSNPIKLYNEKLDPGYTKDLAQQMPEKFVELRRAFYQWLSTQPRPIQWNPEEFDLMLQAAKGDA